MVSYQSVIYVLSNDSIVAKTLYIGQDYEKARNTLLNCENVHSKWLSVWENGEETVLESL